MGEPRTPVFMSAKEVLGYDLPRYPYRMPEEQRTGRAARHPVIVVGAGLVGLTAAVDLSVRGIPVVLLDDSDTVGARGLSSRGVNFARRSLEIWDRLGMGDRVVEKGVVWNVHRTYLGPDTIYAYEMNPDPDQKHPAILALQQYHVEQYLIDRLRELGMADLRWRNEVVSVNVKPDHASVEVRTPDGLYGIEAEYLLACDGAHSAVRKSLGLDSAEMAFDRWFISDVKIETEIARERHLWIDPPFHEGRCALLIEMADGVWRTDMQLGEDADMADAVTPERAMERLDRMFGVDTSYGIVWAGAYSFQFRVLDEFRHGRVFFLGDAAHENPPFGGRGGNGGIQDADNLVWKLDLVLRGRSPDALLDTYHRERHPAAVENIAQTARSCWFLSPQSRGRRLLRDAVLSFAKTDPEIRPLVNTGRMSVPFSYDSSDLITADSDKWEGGPPPGAAVPNCRVETINGSSALAGHLLDDWGGEFVCLYFAGAVADMPEDARRYLREKLQANLPVETRLLVTGGEADADFRTIRNSRNAAFRAYAAEPGCVYLVRPDGHVAARWRTFDPERVETAISRAAGRHAPAGAIGARTPSSAGDLRLPDPERLDERLFERLVDSVDAAAPDAVPVFLERLVLHLSRRIEDPDIVRGAISASLQDVAADARGDSSPA